MATILSVSTNPGILVSGFLISSQLTSKETVMTVPPTTTTDLDFQDLSDAFDGIEVVELDETMTLSETAASSGISSCNSCSCCLSTSCCSVHIGG